MHVEIEDDFILLCNITTQYSFSRFFLSTDPVNESIVVILCHFNSQLWIKNQLNSSFNRHNSLKRYFAQNLALIQMYQIDPAFKT